MASDDAQALQTLIDLARDEDLGDGDLSSEILPGRDQPASFRLLAEQPGVFAGRAVGTAVLAAYDPAIEVVWTERGQDGAAFGAPVDLALLRGPLGQLLSAERVFLNFLQRLCGVASLTRRYVDRVAGTGAAIYDTRKTIPGWRRLDKFAVRCGGGCNHRMGLYDGVIIKDNHVAGIETPRLAGAVFDMLNRLAGATARPSFIMVEADTLPQVEELMKVVGIDVVLLDNFALEDLREAVALRDGLGLSGKVALEASGGVTLETVRAIAETGVDRISVGALTHSAAALSLSLERVA
jgi:nicotinate-nucleotide pyrophosphorylase (carboxylating)